MIELEQGSGNVYADIGAAEPDEMMVKAQLVAKLAEIIEARHFTNQAEAAAVIGLTQPKLSSLLRGNFRGISEAKLMDCLLRLGRDVQIVVGPARARPEPGRLAVVMAS
ncbi:Predicted DNA-binding protein, contains XRE-type HTH domain [Pseudomonas peli]|uniref:Predicted DNA-binding protein, contains XRE-type HTH domain n=1 Tax=Pseudomonas peli TaxID=592361 RepID=A0AB37ZGD5_9PSED|nr:helix-turn-helix transcriptional regulator [Pseudomonas peli]NMZ71349.1 XRE family transcriptional regulator [Pseudomonas peli]SCW89341.1 Predicted DNA-binding protein, contains XRE-type HTH domain [Pseudomonas peli]